MSSPELEPARLAASRGEEFEYTHDLRHLIDLVRLEPADAPFDIRQVIGLIEYAVPLRYEDLLDAEPLDRAAAVALVDEVGRWTEAQLSEPEADESTADEKAS